MHEMTANEAKTRFGELLLMCQRKPVHVSKHGKPVAVLVSAEDFVAIEEIKLELMKLKAELARQHVADGKIREGRAFFDEILKDGNA